MPSTIVCLGNPGTEYKDTRHNAGFLVGERLLELVEGSGVWAAEETKERDVREVTLTGDNGRVIRLYFPLGFMNRSGETLREYLRYRPNKLTLSDVLVVRDELDLPVGSFRAQQSAGSGGHKGAESLKAVFGGEEPFWQLKIGIGRDGKMSVEAYVLQKPAAEEEALFAQAIDKAANFLFDTVVKQERPLEAVTDHV